MQKLSEKIVKLLESEIWQYAETTTDRICFSEEVVNACKVNYCGNYNKGWTCPPNVGTLDELKSRLLKYRYAFVFTTKHNIEDSFDIDGMFGARKVHDKVENKIRKIVDLQKCVILGAGGCNICEKCNFPNPCRFPTLAKTAVEACGIDVVKLAKDNNINYVNGANTVTYFSVLFFN